MSVTANPISVPPAIVRARYGLSRERMARLFNVSAKSIERWEDDPSKPTSTAHRALLRQLTEIVELGQLVYGETGFRSFLHTPLGAFERRTPYQLMANGELDEVLGALAQDYEGLGA